MHGRVRPRRRRVPPVRRRELRRRRSRTSALIFAPDHANVAAELARVARPGGRLGFTAWKPNPKLGELYRRFTEEPIEGREAYEWGREDHVEDMLGEDFELEFEDGTLWLEADSGEEIWELFSESAPPVIALLQPARRAAREEFHQAFVELYEGYRDGEGGIRAPRRYLLDARHAQVSGEVVELLQELIRVDTTNPPGNETAAAELLRDYLEAAGVECELYARVPERANLVARIRGTRRRPVARAALAHRRRARRRRASGSAIRSAASSSTARSGGAARST